MARTTGRRISDQILATAFAGPSLTGWGWPWRIVTSDKHSTGWSGVWEQDEGPQRLAVRLSLFGGEGMSSSFEMNEVRP